MKRPAVVAIQRPAGRALRARHAPGVELQPASRDPHSSSASSDARALLSPSRNRRLLGEEVTAERHILLAPHRPAVDGLRMLLDEIISRRDSSCASNESGNVHGHLVAVEVGVERGAHERVNPDRLALASTGSKRLDARRWSVGARSAMRAGR